MIVVCVACVWGVCVGGYVCVVCVWDVCVGCLCGYGGCIRMCVFMYVCMFCVLCEIVRAVLPAYQHSFNVCGMCGMCYCTAYTNLFPRCT